MIVPCGVALGRVTATATSDVEANTNGIVVLYTDVSAFVNGAAAELSQASDTGIAVSYVDVTDPTVPQYMFGFDSYGDRYSDTVSPRAGSEK